MENNAEKEPGRGAAAAAADRAGVGRQLLLTNDVKVSDLTGAVGHKRTLIEPLVPVSSINPRKGSQTQRPGGGWFRRSRRTFRYRRHCLDDILDLSKLKDGVMDFVCGELKDAFWEAALHSCSGNICTRF